VCAREYVCTFLCNLFMCVSVCLCTCVHVYCVFMSDVMCLCAYRCVCMLRPCVSVCFSEFVGRYTHVPQKKQTQKVILAIGESMQVQAHACIGGKSVGEDMRKLEHGMRVCVSVCVSM